MCHMMTKKTTTPHALVELWCEGVDESWMPALNRSQSALERAANAVLASRARGVVTLPADGNVLRALRVPMANVRVLIVGQDPYPTLGNAVGLAFSGEPGAPIPASLRNIFRELHSDIGSALLDSADLSAWAERGVLLLNRVLVVEEGEPGSLRKTGWEEITLELVRELAQHGGPLVAILWGNDAAALGVELRGISKIVSVHPSPLSAHRGFFGSKPFSRANSALMAQGADAVDWSLPSQTPTLFDA